MFFPMPVRADPKLLIFCWACFSPRSSFVWSSRISTYARPAFTSPVAVLIFVLLTPDIPQDADRCFRFRFCVVRIEEGDSGICFILLFIPFRMEQEINEIIRAAGIIFRSAA